MQSERGFEYGVKHIISPISGSVRDVLLSILQVSSEEVDYLLHLGAIYLNHSRILENVLVSSGDYLRVHTKPRRFPKGNVDFTKRIIFQNEHFVVVNKVSGMPVHGSVDNIRENLQSYMEEALQEKLYVTHRLDVPTNGLIIYAKTVDFQTAFNKLLIAREIKKIYRALIEGPAPTAKTLKHYMEPSPRAPKVVSHEPRDKWQECVLEILEVIPHQEHMELKIHLHTGRTHQIRAQLGFEKSPIIGDHTYGAKKRWDDERIELTACELEFLNPLTGDHHHFKI
ncbi:RluA family pseudouridine synthase [Bdellovibrio sp. SKB1291214]|uniref:RluA family pseudouridine synthase n=1 Tax=Bdellovibrio sp. SKB1291214 TaxID=1732569 RepID=UPI000B51B9DE|nr:RluA family pseudouridine synthase [Bdellovibrio sp. SKB1291214]UYL07692.1 RluA family pseudouridine synthase [Bdellovibrio sp. SKB1291214]